MPKRKTKKSAAKRFKITGTGKVMFKRAGKRHMLGSKSAKRKARLRHAASMIKGDANLIIECLPYGNR